jgi:hypothetical protein
MSGESKNFNPDVLFLYRTTRKTVGSVIVPAFDLGKTDWNRRLTDAPTVSKESVDWTGKPTSGEIVFTIADTDGSVTLTVGQRLGDPVAMFFKASENPLTWWPVFEGNITKTMRSQGLYTITVTDAVKNIYNSQFISDYVNLGTTIGNNIYGTVKDVIGTNVYLDDMGDVQWIRRRIPGDDSWWASITGAALGALAGAVSGGFALLPALIGAGGGFLQGIPKGGAYDRFSVRVNDQNIISDDEVLGGQMLKFYAGSISGWAQNTESPLFPLVAQHTRGGTFMLGLHGTIYMEDMLHGVQKGDYIYSELPLYFRGSPDDVIVNMLTGKNTTVKYTFPDDFSWDWSYQTAPLRHIDCWGLVSNFESGAVADIINKLSEEFGFSFYVDESNRFAIRTLRSKSIGTDVLGTFTEDYNIIGDTEYEYDLQTSYTDLVINYRDTFIGDMYGMKVQATLNSASFYGGVRRVKEINSEWIHDKLTGEYMIERYKRRFATPVPVLKFTAPLYSAPIHIGEIIRVSGYACGSMVPYEISKYQKDFARSSVDIEAECVGSYYGAYKYGYLDGSCYCSTFAPMDYPGQYGAIPYAIDDIQTSITVSGPVYIQALSVGMSFTFNTATKCEMIQILAVEGQKYSTDLAGQAWFTYKVKRGALNSQPQAYPAGAAVRQCVYGRHKTNNDDSIPYIWY